jgi:outer membrane protein assembly factor BamB
MGFRDRRTFLAEGAASAAAILFPRHLRGAEPPPSERYWPQWRGPLSTGEGPYAKPPLEWAEGKNVRYKVELPGGGKSTPIVWGELLIVTSAIPIDKKMAPRVRATEIDPARRNPSVEPPAATQEFVVMALSRADGKVRWRRTLREEHPHEGTHQDGSFAGGSALTDGERIYAFFGSRGLYALDFEGKVLWEKDLGVMRTRNAFGEGASPALFGDSLVVNWDHEGDDFIAAFDAKTGKERWRKGRDEPTTWSTPLVVSTKDRAQVVVGATNGVRGYDLATGEPLWEAPGLTANVIPSPVSADGLVYAMSGFRGNALRAVRLADARGLVSSPPGLAWSYDQDTPYVPSPALYRGGLYFLKSNSGILTCLDAGTGALRYKERLDAVPNVYASPVVADGRIYVVGREGGAVVLQAGPEPKVLATNKLDDGFDASPALVDGEMYLRGRKYLYRISG